MYKYLLGFSSLKWASGSGCLSKRTGWPTFSVRISYKTLYVAIERVDSRCKSFSINRVYKLLGFITSYFRLKRSQEFRYNVWDNQSAFWFTTTSIVIHCFWSSRVGRGTCFEELDRGSYIWQFRVLQISSFLKNILKFWKK